jgi:hypothetical protein
MQHFRIGVLAATIVCCAAQEIHAQGSDSAWGAFAVYCERNRGGCFGGIAAGFGLGPTRALASRIANADCLSGLKPGYTCKIIHTFNKGCGYIAVGWNNAIDRGGYAVGPSAQAAAAKCASQGFDCSRDAPQGGCVAP